MVFPCGSAGEESTCKAWDLCSIPGLGRSPGEGKGYPLQYSGLENSMDYSPWGHKELDTAEQLSLSLSNLPCGLEISLQISTQEKWTGVSTEICLCIHTAAIFIIVPKWKQLKCPSADEWINTVWFIHMIEYNSTIKIADLQNDRCLNFSCFFYRLTIWAIQYIFFNFFHNFWPI